MSKPVLQNVVKYSFALLVLVQSFRSGFSILNIAILSLAIAMLILDLIIWRNNHG